MKKCTFIITLILACFIIASCDSVVVTKPKKDDITTSVYVNEIGKYPQTKVTEQEKIDMLKATNEKSTEGYILLDGEEYHLYNGEYFKVEPIKWIEVSSGDAKLQITEKIIDAQVFMSDEYFSPNIYSYVTKPGVPEKIHANNYYYSDLRAWLNNNFLYTAFTTQDIDKLMTIEVDNSAETTMNKDNKYFCQNSSDKVIALSVKEATTFINPAALPTDYAVARGVKVHNDEKIAPEANGYAAYWLRSPCDFYSYSVSGINYDGLIYNYINCYYNEIGVRPVIACK